MGTLKKLTLEEAFKSFLETDSVKKTKKSFEADRRFFKISLYFFGSRNRTFVHEIELEDIELFCLWLEKDQEIGSFKKEAWCQPSIALRVQVLKKLFRKLLLTERIKKNPFDLFKLDRGQSKRRRPMSLEEFDRIFGLAPEWFKPILRFMRLTGSRGASVATLTWADIDFERGALILRSRKGGLRRVKEIPFPLYPALRDLLSFELLRLAKTPAPEANVFHGPSGSPVIAQDIATAGSQLIQKAGLRGKVVLYGLRHAIATEMTEAGVPLEIIRQAMGHSNIMQTSHYASGIASKSVADALEKIRKSSG